MQSFYHFRRGALIPDSTINAWVRECVNMVSAGKPHYNISSGDTSVLALDYGVEVRVQVANSSGYSEIQCSKHPDALPVYTRPE